MGLADTAAARAVAVGVELTAPSEFGDGGTGSTDVPVEAVQAATKRVVPIVKMSAAPRLASLAIATRPFRVGFGLPERDRNLVTWLLSELDGLPAALGSPVAPTMSVEAKTDEPSQS